jgi:hypothetical protein
MSAIKTLPPHHRLLVESFVSRAIDHMTKAQYNDDRSEARPDPRVKRDLTMVKTAELGFQAALYEDHGLASMSDFHIYKSYAIGDDGDILLNGWKIEVKAGGPRSHFLMMPESKIVKCDRGGAPDFVVFCRVSGWDVEPVGWIPWLRAARAPLFRRGDLLPAVAGVALHTDNRIVHYSLLDLDFTRLARILKTHKRGWSRE